MLEVAQAARAATTAETTTPTPVAKMVVSVATETDRAAWDAYVDACLAPPRGGVPGATGYHSWAWRDVFARSFGHESVYLVARRSDPESICGVLPLTEVRSLLFGRSLTSLPFLNYGGVVAGSNEAATALVDAAVRIAWARGCRHV